MIRTVLGDIDKTKLGRTLAHEHFYVDLDRVRHDGISKIDQLSEVEPEIIKAMDQGIEATIEVTTIDLSRDVNKLVQISKDTGLKIVCATGFYLDEFHPEWLKDASVEDIENIYIKELNEGIDCTSVRAGIIGEIASGKETISDNERKILVAAARASNRTGAAIYTHTNKPNTYETIKILLDEKVNPDRVIIGHQDLIDDHDYHLSILSAGFNVGFDTVGKKAYMKDEIRADNIKKLIDKGYVDHIVLSNDVSRHTYFTSYGGYGYIGVTSILLPLLRQINVSEVDINKLLIDNPARILDNPNWK